MTCVKFEDLVAERDGLLPEEARREQAEHISACPRCQQLARRWRELSSLLGVASPGQPLGRTPSCPSEAELLEFLGGGLAEAQGARVQTHLAGCFHCLQQLAAMVHTVGEPVPPVTAEWQAALQEAEALVGEAPQETVGKIVWGSPGWRWAFATATAATVALAAWLWYAGSPPEAPSPAQTETPAVASQPPSPGPAQEGPQLLAQQTEPAPTEGGLTPPDIQVRKAITSAHPALQVVWPQEGGQVPREGLEVRWQALPEAELYNVTILNRRGDVVWEGQAKGARLRLPSGLKLGVGERYFVWVVAHVKGQGAVRSPSVGFEIQP